MTDLIPVSGTIIVLVSTSPDDPVADSIQLVGATGDKNYVRSH
jgi:hypothetical protein